MNTTRQSSLIPSLSAAQRRHLREMAGDGSRPLSWRPANNGEAACALVLRRKGLLSGSFLTYSDGYELTDEGLRVALALLESDRD